MHVRSSLALALTPRLSARQNFGNMAGAAAAQFMGGDGQMGGAVGAMGAQFAQQHYDKASEVR